MHRIYIEYTGSIQRLPNKATKGSVAYDLFADIQYTLKCNPLIHAYYTGVDEEKLGKGKLTMRIEPGTTLLVETGFKMQLSEGLEAQIRPRSGLALKEQVTVGNSPGTIDEDFRGNVKVMLINHNDQPYEVQHGDRIAQMVINEVPKTVLIEHKIDETDRGTGGFGHTGR